MSRNNKKDEQQQRFLLEDDIAIHIFSVSAAMVGVCLTVVGIVRLIAGMTRIETLADDGLALGALLFLGSCLLSYVALRGRSRKRSYTLERVADMLFLTGLSLLAIVAVVITYALI